MKIPTIKVNVYVEEVNVHKPVISNNLYEEGAFGDSTENNYSNSGGEFADLEPIEFEGQGLKTVGLSAIKKLLAPIRTSQKRMERQLSKLTDATDKIVTFVGGVRQEVAETRSRNAELESSLQQYIQDKSVDTARIEELLNENNSSADRLDAAVADIVNDPAVPTGDLSAEAPAEGATSTEGETASEGEPPVGAEDQQPAASGEESNPL